MVPDELEVLLSQYSGPLLKSGAKLWKHFLSCKFPERIFFGGGRFWRLVVIALVKAGNFRFFAELTKRYTG
jgi:hypothetical protein